MPNMVFYIVNNVYHYLVDIIEEVLLKNDVLYDNARIIANLMEFDEKVS